MLNSAKLFLFFLSSLLLGLAANSLHLISLKPLIFIFSSFVVLFLVSDKRLLLYLSLLIIALIISFYRVHVFNGNILISNQGMNKYSGFVVSEPETRGKSQVFTLCAEDGRNYEVKTNQFPKYQFADYLKVEGDLSSRNTKRYAAKNISGSLNYPHSIARVKNNELPFIIALRKRLIGIKNIFQKKVGLLLPNANAGLINGVIFGTRATLDQSLRDLLVSSGTIHIIALSGFNITIIIDFFRRLTLHFSRVAMFILTTLGIIIFILATGISASIVRAAIMGWVWLLAKQVGRQDDPLIAILFSAGVMAFLNPYIIFYDIGFQLSFAAFIGLIYLAPLFSAKLSFLGKGFGELFSASLGATVATIPILSYHFEGFSVIAPLSNLFILPFIPLLMLSGFLLGVTALMWPLAAAVFTHISWLLSEYFIRTISFFGKLSYASIDFRINSPVIVILFYLLLIQIILLNKRNYLGKKEV
jgi:competence protein ComEC